MTVDAELDTADSEEESDGFDAKASCVDSDSDTGSVGSHNNDSSEVRCDDDEFEPTDALCEEVVFMQVCFAVSCICMNTSLHLLRLHLLLLLRYRLSPSAKRMEAVRQAVVQLVG